ncbi:hypothetical protein [Aliivibrio fischeri]|uniref:Uncharacterized protein n=1 Tax=Aliivibrio fischeri TaxID=668 RepID=A0A510UKH5_ALIFS|nr:hypothetical protein [Aliivibrio fischeri]GEK13850.1 hypothetical protein AFI02nite_18860 [Aliivibrio fischeri]
MMITLDSYKLNLLLAWLIMPINNLSAGKEPFSRAKIKNEEDAK